MLFEHYYDKILTRDANRPFKMSDCSFFHGGKCSDIKKYFASRSFQMTIKWIFVLDSDGAANDLKAFLEGKYKDYIGKDIFIYQYSVDNRTSDIELEDLLSERTLVDVCIQLGNEIGIQLPEASVIDIFGNYQIPFAKRLEKVVGDIIPKENKESFKALFKDNLNKKIRELLGGNKDEPSFKANFPLYETWVRDCISKLLIKKENKPTALKPSPGESSSKMS